MSAAALVLVEHAEFLRTSAARWRRLADETSTPDVSERLIRLAAELEDRAHELEMRARSIAKTVAKTRTLSAEIQRLAEEAGRRAKRLRRKPGSDSR